MQPFQHLIWQHYSDNKRSFPWRETSNTYEIFVSEIMLQQTQTQRVVPKYEEFIRRFPTFKELAGCTVAELLTYWQGLGYNRRALNLQRTAKIITEEYGGVMPHTKDELLKLPGIGEYTASAIMAFAYNQPVTLIETNIRRVFIHHFFADSDAVDDKQLLPLIAETVDQKNPREWYWALMDYGASLPKKVTNPNRRSKHYTKQSAFEGSNRQLRGAIIKLLTKKPLSPVHIAEELDMAPEKIQKCLSDLENEGFLREQDSLIALAG